MYCGVIENKVCLLGDNLLFLGSRLGDSLLIQYAEKQDDVTKDEGRPEKRIKTEQTVESIHIS